MLLGLVCECPELRSAVSVRLLVMTLTPWLLQTSLSLLNSSPGAQPSMFASLQSKCLTKQMSKNVTLESES